MKIEFEVATVVIAESGYDGSICGEIFVKRSETCNRSSNAARKMSWAWRQSIGFRNLDVKSSSMKSAAFPPRMAGCFEGVSKYPFVGALDVVLGVFGAWSSSSHGSFRLPVVAGVGYTPVFIAFFGVSVTRMSAAVARSCSSCPVSGQGKRSQGHLGILDMKSDT